MRRAIKKNDSPIITENLRYPTHRARIREILIAEQNNFCAYTDDRITETLKVEIDHFNPNLKSAQPHAGYENWYAISGKYNLKKSDNWCEPILHPIDEQFEQRIVYYDGFYFEANPEDTEAKNLINLLDIDNPKLVQMRKDYINSLKELLADAYNNDFDKLLKYLLKHPIHLRFSRAFEEEFKIKLAIFEPAS